MIEVGGTGTAVAENLVDLVFNVLDNIKTVQSTCRGDVTLLVTRSGKLSNQKSAKMKVLI